MYVLIGQLRERAGFTQSQLAQKCKVSQQYISKIETNKCMPSFRVALIIAQILGCTIDDLYETKSDKEAQR